MEDSCLDIPDQGQLPLHGLRHTQAGRGSLGPKALKALGLSDLPDTSTWPLSPGTANFSIYLFGSITGASMAPPGHTAEH